jgi:hypothetical protein
MLGSILQPVVKNTPIGMFGEGGGTPPITETTYLLLENNSFLLLEDGFKILLTEAI